MLVEFARDLRNIFLTEVVPPTLMMSDSKHLRECCGPCQQTVAAEDVLACRPKEDEEV